MDRARDSHKGDNGKVLIIGGSRLMHGAPLLAALAAQASGADLMYVSLPLKHQSVARQTALNFQVHPFHGDDLGKEDLEMLLEIMATMDCAVLGPGIAKEGTALTVLEELVASAACPLVLDATALQPSTLALVQGKPVVLTPHLGELERMGVQPDGLATAAQQHGVTVFLKGPTDRIACADGTEKMVEGGNAGLTVGGTGDALAGLIAGLMAQGVEPADACVTAGTIVKRAATVLFHDLGYAFTARDVIGQMPHLLHTYDAP